jgi:hypothetical protein
MTYSVYQHWDPLRVCIVGRSYEPEFYSFIENARVRNVLERIAYETEEDYQKLIKLLKSFNVEILRPNVHTHYEEAFTFNNKIKLPPMTPRDYTATIGNTFYIDTNNKYEIIRGSDWPEKCPKNINDLPDWILKELSQDFNNAHLVPDRSFEYKDIISTVKNKMSVDVDRFVSTAGITRIGKDIYISYDGIHQEDQFKERHSEFRFHKVSMDGHSDGYFCPVVPGLIVSLFDVQEYKKTYPGWEVVYLPNQSWNKIKSFMDLKRKNQGKWWVPGEELNNDFTNFVESWLGHWVGYVEETVFDVNMLVIDRHNVVCNNYNNDVFDAFERHGVTPHIINFRHRYFWDGGLHCITSDVHREGTMEDYFPERG